MSEKIQLSAEQVFVAWKNYVSKEIGKLKYTQEERLEILEELCMNYRKYGVAYDDAEFLRKKFMEFVVTKEGMKGNGRYKGWKERALEDYDSCLIKYYDEDIEQVEVEKPKEMGKSKEDYGIFPYLPRNVVVVDWSKRKFGDSWSESICLECHKICSDFNNLFCDEVLFADFQYKDENKKPDWLKKYL